MCAHVIVTKKTKNTHEENKHKPKVIFFVTDSSEETTL